MPLCDPRQEKYQNKESQTLFQRQKEEKSFRNSKRRDRMASSPARAKGKAGRGRKSSQTQLHLKLLSGAGDKAVCFSCVAQGSEPSKANCSLRCPLMKLADISKYQNTRNMEKTSSQSANSSTNDLKDTEMS